MDLHYRQELQVGLLVIVAATMLIIGLIWLSGRSLGGGAAKFEVRFASIQGLSSGDPVHISGVRVGRVAGHDIEGVDQIIVRLEVRREFRPRSDARVSVKSLARPPRPLFPAERGSSLNHCMCSPYCSMLAVCYSSHHQSQGF